MAIFHHFTLLLPHALPTTDLECRKSCQKREHTLKKLPRPISMEMIHRPQPVETIAKTKVLVDNARLFSGILGKKTWRISAASMECGDDLASQLPDHIQLVGNHCLMLEGHSLASAETIGSNISFGLESIRGDGRQSSERFVNRRLSTHRSCWPTPNVEGKRILFGFEHRTCPPCRPKR